MTTANPMDIFALTAVSPLDGRYGSKTTDLLRASRLPTLLLR